MKFRKLYLILECGCFVLLTGCDALLHMTYSIENKSKEAVTLFIPNFPTKGISEGWRSEHNDTVLTLQPNQVIMVGVRTDIDFPFATKNIYKNYPGICGIKRRDADTSIDLGCTQKEWKYKRKNSNLKIQ